MWFSPYIKQVGRSWISLFNVLINIYDLWVHGRTANNMKVETAIIRHSFCVDIYRSERNQQRIATAIYRRYWHSRVLVQGHWPSSHNVPLPLWLMLCGLAIKNRNRVSLFYGEGRIYGGGCIIVNWCRKCTHGYAHRGQSCVTAFGCCNTACHKQGGWSARCVRAGVRWGGYGGGSIFMWART